MFSKSYALKMNVVQIRDRLQIIDLQEVIERCFSKKMTQGDMVHYYQTQLDV